MSAPARSSAWARELLVGRAIWQPLGVTFSLWAWFGWLTLWLAALLPESSGLKGPNAAIFIMAAAVLGYASAALGTRSNLASSTLAIGRLLALLALLGTAWWTHLSSPAGGGSQGGVIRAVALLALLAALFVRLKRLNAFW